MILNLYNNNKIYKLKRIMRYYQIFVSTITDKLFKLLFIVLIRRS